MNDTHDIPALQILGSLYAATGKRDKAIHNLKRVTETNPKDPDVWIELAELIERQKNYSEALQGKSLLYALHLGCSMVKSNFFFAPHTLAYEKSVPLLQASGKPVSPELWNNIGVLRHQLGITRFLPGVSQTWLIKDLQEISRGQRKLTRMLWKNRELQKSPSKLLI